MKILGSRLKKLWYICLNLLIPLRCGICGAYVDSPNTLCSCCFAKLRFITEPYCPVCGRPFEYQMAKGMVCGSCLKEKPKYKNARAVFVYDDMSKKLLLPFKHGDRTDLTPLLVKFMYQCGRELITKTDMIIPVPLHQTRLMKRRYNQAALLALGLSRKSNLPYGAHLLQRHRATKSQGHMKASERAHNVRNAFCVVHDERIKDKRILLIDDVYTTGATVNACVKTLLAAKAKEVYVLTLAKVVKS